MTEYLHVSALLVRKSDLSHHFSAQGRLQASVEMMATGDDLMISPEFQRSGCLVDNNQISLFCWRSGLWRRTVSKKRYQVAVLSETKYLRERIG